METGCVHLYCGDGKGKTTAAMGLALRAAGQGFAVGVAQFLKDGSSGECRALAGLAGVTLFPFLPEVPFTFAMTPEQRGEAARFYAELLGLIEQRRELDLVVLDEVLDAVGTGLFGGNGAAFVPPEPAGRPGSGPDRAESIRAAAGRRGIYHRYAGGQTSLRLRAVRQARRRMVGVRGMA